MQAGGAKVLLLESPWNRVAPPGSRERRTAIPTHMIAMIDILRAGAGTSGRHNSIVGLATTKWCKR